MIVPIDLLKPIFEDLLTIGRPNRPPRPWLGALRHRGRQQRRRSGAGRAAARRSAPTCAPATSCSGVARHRRERPRRAFPPRLGAGPGRRDGPAADQSRRQDLRRPCPLRRSPPLPEGAGAALNGKRHQPVIPAGAIAPRRRLGLRWCCSCEPGSSLGLDCRDDRFARPAWTACRGAMVRCFDDLGRARVGVRARSARKTARRRCLLISPVVRKATSA